MTFASTEKDVNTAPLPDRQAARAEYQTAMAEQPELVAERIGWLINGTYGYDEMLQAKRILAAGPRANKIASLGMVIAVLEWRCPARFAAQAWNALTQAQQTRQRALIARVIERAARDASAED